MTKYPEAYLQKTIALFQPYFAETLTLEDAESIADCALDVYEYVLELKQKEKPYGKEEKTSI